MLKLILVKECLWESRFPLHQNLQVLVKKHIVGVNGSSRGVGSKDSSGGKDPGFRCRGPTMVRCSLGQRRHFHLTQKGKESHPRRVVTEREKGLAWRQGSINRFHSITYIYSLRIKQRKHHNRDNTRTTDYMHLMGHSNILEIHPTEGAHTHHNSQPI